MVYNLTFYTAMVRWYWGVVLMPLARSQCQTLQGFTNRCMVSYLARQNFRVGGDGNWVFGGGHSDGSGNTRNYSKKKSQHSDAAQAVLHEFKAILVCRKNSYSVRTILAASPPHGNGPLVTRLTMYKTTKEVGMVGHAWNPSTQGTVAGGLLQV